MSEMQRIAGIVVCMLSWHAVGESVGRPEHCNSGILQIVETAVGHWGMRHMSVILIAIVATIAHFVIFFLAGNGSDNLEFSGDNHGESFAADGFLDARNAGAVVPIIQFPAQLISFVLQGTELAGCVYAMAAGGVDVGNRGVDNG